MPSLTATLAPLTVGGGALAFAVTLAILLSIGGRRARETTSLRPAYVPPWFARRNMIGAGPAARRRALAWYALAGALGTATIAWWALDGPGYVRFFDGPATAGGIVPLGIAPLLCFIAVKYGYLGLRSRAIRDSHNDQTRRDQDDA